MFDVISNRFQLIYMSLNFLKVSFAVNYVLDKEINDSTSVPTPNDYKLKKKKQVKVTTKKMLKYLLFQHHEFNGMSYFHTMKKFGPGI